MDNTPGSVRIGVLIDADNISPRYAEAILDELARYGTPTIKRAYGDFSSPRLGGWTRELNLRAIKPIHQNAYTTGKNSTDSALIIDAMDLLYAGNVEAFAIVSSDSDFTSLATRLRESGRTVYGIGRERTPASLQSACDKFIRLEVLGAPDATEEQAEAADAPDTRGDNADDAPPPQLNLESVLTRAINATGHDDGWAAMAAIASHINRSHPSFDPRNFDHAKLSSLVAAQPYLDVEGTGSAMRVRTKQGGKSTPRTARKSTAKTTKTAKTAKAAAAAETTEAPAQAAEPAAKAPAKRTAKRAAKKTSPKAAPEAAVAPAEQVDVVQTPARPVVTKTTRTRKLTTPRVVSRD